MHFRMSIDGEDVLAASGQTFDVTNPATGEVVADVAKGGPEDVDRAARAAQTAFKDGRWAGMSATVRGRVLLRLANLIREHAEELATLETVQGGKTIADSRSRARPAALSTTQAPRTKSLARQSQSPFVVSTSRCASPSVWSV